MIKAILFNKLSWVVLAGAVALVPWFIPAAYRTRKSLPLWWGYIASAVILASIAVFCFLQLIYPSYADHLAPSLTMGALMLRDGHTLYSDGGALSTTALLYGPSVYLMNLIGVSIGFTPIFGTKLISICIVILSGVAMAAVTFRNFTKPISGFLMVYFTVATMIFCPSVFQPRADGLMVAAVAIALWAITRCTPKVGLVLCAMAVSLVCNGKIHGILYCLPLFSIAWIRYGKRWTVLMVAVSSMFTLLPFLTPWVSAVHYGALLHLIRHYHPLIFSIGVWNSVFIVFLMTPVWIVWWCRPHLGRDEWAPIISLGVAIIAVTVIASKEGAGYWHYLPFFPVITWVLGRMITRLSTPMDFLTTASLWQWSTVMMVATLFFTSAGSYFYVVNYSKQIKVCTELIQIRERFPDKTMMMGYSDREYESTFLRPMLHRRGQPYLWDAGALMDLREAGISPTFHRMLDENINLVVLPNGHPFRLKSWYSSKFPLFSEEFESNFLRHYRCINIGHYFTVWSRFE